MEPWDGPAAIAATDGRWVIGGLDRNGLRPMRYTVTARRAADRRLRDRHGEAGRGPRSSQKGRVGPGQMHRRRPRRGALLRGRGAEGHARRPQALRQVDRAHHPHRRASCKPSPTSARDFDREELRRRQLAMGYTLEELEVILHPMVEDGKEAIGSMGDDTPIAVLSDAVSRPAPLLPPELQPGHQPADRQPARDAGDDAASTRLGNLGNILDEDPTQCDMLQLESPVLSNARVRRDARLHGQHGLRRSTAPGRCRTARPGCAARSSASAARPRRACAPAAPTSS